MREEVIGGQRLILGDCLEVLPTLAAGSVDAVVTDPPYGIHKAEWDDAFPTQWIPLAWGCAPRMLVMPGNSALIDAANAVGEYVDCVVLHNLNGMSKSAVAFGNWIPVLCCGDWKWQARPNVLRFSVSTKEKIDHPSPKPLAAMLALLDKYTREGWALLDPFMGSGTTLVAAELLGRRGIGIEIDPGYFDVACKRVEEAVRKRQADAAQLTLTG